MSIGMRRHAETQNSMSIGMRWSGKRSAGSVGEGIGADEEG